MHEQQVLDRQQNALHPVERAARLHADFVGIHPFVDGNGRTSRLLMNFELPTGDYTLFINFIAMLEKQALTRYLNVIENV